ncbi:helix-turn-helix transcriptional regulator [Ramlibacter sp. 2FC]|uniref:helix-turn-helix domain-containing protein n=1 Tax=Ramlibacter sp. 2FC TaxID=2502188 RepID=UPI0010F4389F|nr:helix-turn-helix transcriptional regulator [Ramlibacter sp. 2FC]
MHPSLSIRCLADLGAAFRRERKALKLTQAEVARRGGMRRETVIKLESGSNVDALTLLKAISALGKALRIAEVERLEYEELQKFFDADDDK